MGVGKVYIVGAGPGAADLITVRGLRAVRRADVLVCDGLLPGSLLDELGVSTEGKSVYRLGAGGARLRQDEVNELMRCAAADGKTVVRLKGGDPFVFGRGAEEAEFLTEQGIAWELIPGLSAATAAPGLAGLPLTERARGRSFAVVSARAAGGSVNESFPRADSLVVFMGVSVLDDVVARLLADGWSRETPAAVVERAAQPWERRAYGPLADIASVAAAGHVGSPAVLVLGVAAARGHAFQARPVVLFTGLDPTNFRTLGDLLHWPALEVTEDPTGRASVADVVQALARGEFAWAVFTSRAGVSSFFGALEERHLDVRALAGTRVVTAGAGTGQRLAEHGLRADAVPAEAGTKGILATLGDVRGAGVLLVQGSHAPAGLEQGIAERGGRAVRLALHRVRPHPELGRPLPEHDVIYFVSPSGVRAYRDVYGEDAFRREIWCIGEVTLAEVKRLGFEAKVVEPHVPTDENAKIAAD